MIPTATAIIIKAFTHLYEVSITPLVSKNLMADTHTNTCAYRCSQTEAILRTQCMPGLIMKLNKIGKKFKKE